MAKKEQITVSDILKPYNEHIQSTIPGKCLFNTYTYKSQMGIMKGHIFYALHCIPANKLGKLFQTLFLKFFILFFTTLNSLVFFSNFRLFHKKA